MSSTMTSQKNILLLPENMNPKKVLLDSSSAILLFKSDLFHYLLKIYKVTISNSVYKKLTIKIHSGSREFKNYIQNKKMTVKHPDSIVSSARTIIEKARANDEVFRYCVVHITSKYETSQIMGMDAVFVDLAENYYLSGQAFWADSALTAKIADRVDRLKPNLLGKQAPQMVLVDTLMKPASLYSFQSDYFVLYFYDPDCGHCKKKTPVLKELYDSKLKDMGVTVVATNIKKDVKRWKEYIREQDLNKISLSPSLADTVLSDFTIQDSEKKSQPGSLLTAREREILKLITEGITNQGIGQRLFISPSTVDTHRKNIMSKLDIHSVAGLVKFAIRHKIATP